MPFRFLEPVILRALACSTAVAAATLATPCFAAADGCPTWTITGSVTAGDGSTIPGQVELWDSAMPHYWGAHAPDSPIVLTGADGSPMSGQWWAMNGSYFSSLFGGSFECWDGDPCGSCSGGFGLQLYAKQGAIDGALKVEPVPPTGLAGFDVSISRTPDGPFIGTATDANGHFEFRASTEPGRSNNWGVGVDPTYNPWPHSGVGQATYYVFVDGEALAQVSVSSSQLSTVELKLPNPRAEGGGSPSNRGDSEDGGGCGGGSGGGPGGAGGGPGSGPGTGEGGGGRNSPPKPCNPGKPVSVQTGNVYFDQTDVSVPGIQGLVFVRSYNSRNAYHNVPSDMSRGWSHSYGRSLSFPDAISIDFRGDDGVARYYQDPGGDSVFEAVLPATERTWFTRDGGGYRRHFPGGAYDTYDSAGRLTAVVDVAGNVTSLSRDPSGRLQSVTDAGGRSLVLEYDEGGRIVGLSVGGEVVASYGYDQYGSNNLLETVRYPDGSGYSFTSDEAGQVLRVSDAAGKPIESHTYGSHPFKGYGLTSELADGREKLTVTYDTFSTVVTDGTGNATTYHWAWIDGLRRVTKIEGPCRSCGGGVDTREWGYDSNGWIVSHSRAGQSPSVYTRDSAGRVASIEDPIGRTATYTYDSQGRVLTATSPGGGLVTYTYGPFGPLTITEKLTETTSRTTTYTYTALGQVHTVTDPRGKTTTYTYTAAGDLHTVIDPLNHTTTFEYDALGRRTGVTDALARTATTTYDSRGRATRVTSPDQTHTDFAYDLSGRRTSVTDPLGRTTRWVYDEYDRLASVLDPLDGVTRYEYDLDGALTALTDARGQTTSFGHDAVGRVTTVTYPGGAQETFTYDAAGRLATKTDRRGIVTTYAYDGLGRLTAKSYSNGDPAVSYTYNPAGRLQTAANGTDTLTWSYDLAGQLLSEQSARHGSTVATSHDLAGNRLSLSLDGQLFVGYGYDDASRLTTITRGSHAFGFSYDAVNRRTAMTYPNAITTSYAYDDLNRLTSLGAVLNGTTPITSFGYSYDAAGNRLTKATPEFTESYGYDPLYRLTGVERTGSQTGLWRFGYDSVGNRTTAQADNSVQSSTYNEKNQLLASSGGGALKVRGTLDEPGTATVNGQPARMLAGNVFETTIQATPGTNTLTVEATDFSGNVTTKSYEVPVSGSAASFSYDANGNLLTKTEGADTWTYEWNAEGQLKRVLLNGSEVARFAYDPNGRRVERVAAGVTTSYVYDGLAILREVRGSTTLKYVNGPGIDMPLAREEGSGTLTYYHQDGLGSIVRHTNQAGVVGHEYRYDAWGDIEMGATQPGYAFTAREWDPDTQLYYYRARYYDPRIARFISEDPIGARAGITLYAYVGNRPIGSVDPLGLVDWDCSVRMTGVGLVIVGGGGFFATCKACGGSGKEKVVDITGWWAGATFGLKISTNSSRVTLRDTRARDAEPDENVFWGLFKYGGLTGAAGPWGGGGSLLIQIGEARSWFDSGTVDGWKNLDASISLVGGKVTDVKATQ